MHYRKECAARTSTHNASHGVPSQRPAIAIQIGRRLNSSSVVRHVRINITVCSIEGQKKGSGRRSRSCLRSQLSPLPNSHAPTQNPYQPANPCVISPLSPQNAIVCTNANNAGSVRAPELICRMDRKLQKLVCRQDRAARASTRNAPHCAPSQRPAIVIQVGRGRARRRVNLKRLENQHMRSLASSQ